MTNIPQALQLPELRFTLVDRRSKVPLEKDWQNTNNYEWNNARLHQHIQYGGNYGVLCGQGGLIVIDADTPELATTIENNLPPTFTVQTGSGGRHYYYLCPEFTKKVILTVNGKHYGEIQSTATQVIAPGSLHPNGNTYTIINDTPIIPISKEKIILALKQFIPRAQEVISEDEPNETSITSIIKTDGFIKHGDELQGPHPVHGSETGQNFSINTTKNIWHCFRCNTGGSILSLIAILEGIIKCEEARIGALKGKAWPLIVEAAKKYGIKLDEIDPSKFLQKTPTGLTRFMPDNFYQELDKKHKIIKIIGDSDLYYYDPDRGIWKTNAEELAKRELGKLGNEFKNHYYNEGISYIQGKTLLLKTPFTENLNLICLKNCVLDINTMQTLAFSPDHYLAQQLPIKYDPKATCPNIKKFLEETLPPHDIENILQLFGYCLYRGMPIHKSFMFTGSGANGKSTLINIYKTFLGQENTTAISLQRLTQDRFSTATLINKLADLYADLTDEAITETGIFKMLTGGDMISAEKKFGGHINFINYAKLIFSCNKVPEVKDDSDAFYRRWVIINFPNQFLGEKADKKLTEKITTEEELSGLLNLIIPHLKKLLETGEFSSSKTTEEVRQDYKRKSNPTWSFVTDMLLADPEGIIPKDDLYEKFIDYCKAKNYTTMANNQFAKKLKQEAEWVKDESKRLKGQPNKRQRVWIGINYALESLRNSNYQEALEGERQDKLSPEELIEKQQEVEHFYTTP